MSALAIAPTSSEPVTESTILRIIPSQGRAHSTVGKLKQAALELLADPEVGRDRLTTAMVAERAGVSIGTCYRYFEDRIAILEEVWPERRDTYYDVIGKQ